LASVSDIYTLSRISIDVIHLLSHQKNE